MQYLAVYNDLLFEAIDEPNLQVEEVKIQGMKIFSKEEFDAYISKIDNHNQRIEWYYNSDDVMEYSDGRELLGRISIRPIKSPEDYNLLFSICTNKDLSFGNFPILEQVIVE